MRQHDSAFYVISLGFSCWAMWPNKANDISEYDDDESTHSVVKDRNVEMSSIQAQSFAQNDTPFTPRTQAFHTLNQDLPLRQHQNARFG
jgi:hypothetical protein